MSSEIKNIYQTIKQQTDFINNEMNRAGYTSLGLHEEAITDLILNRIQCEHMNNVLTKKFTHKEEGNYTGADWLWSFGERGSWITFAVQAKITNLKTNRVNYLHYREGDQYRKLINFCKYFRFIPKYSIYSKIDNKLDIFSKKLSVLKILPLEEWSFTAISPKYIKNLKTEKEKNFEYVLNYSIPWTYILNDREKSNKKLAEVIAFNLENIYWLLENEYRKKSNQEPVTSFKTVKWENPQPSQMITEKLPLLILYLATNEKFPFKVPLSNISIVSKSPINKLIREELREIEVTRKWKSFPEVFKRHFSTENDNVPRYYLNSF